MANDNKCVAKPCAPPALIKPITVGPIRPVVIAVYAFKPTTPALKPSGDKPNARILPVYAMPTPSCPKQPKTVHVDKHGYYPEQPHVDKHGYFPEQPNYSQPGKPQSAEITHLKNVISGGSTMLPKGRLLPSGKGKV